MTETPLPKCRVLFFTRPTLVPDFIAMADPLRDTFDIHMLCDGRNEGVPSTASDFYAAYKARTRCAELTAEIVGDIITRCRLASRLDLAEAERRVHAIGSVYAGVLDRVAPQAIFSNPVDDYTYGTLCHLARGRGLPYLVHYPAYFPGWSALGLYEHGTPIVIRAPHEDEIDAALEQTKGQAFRADYNLRPNLSWRNHLRAVLRYRVKQVYHAWRKMIERDPLSAYYNQTPYVGSSRHLGWFARDDWFRVDWRDALAARYRDHPDLPVVYCPLSFYPEMSTSYWTLNRRAVAYEALVLSMLRSLQGQATVMVKEHVHMLGIRDPALYAAINKMDHVISAAPQELSNAVLEASDLVLLGSGSVGVEATLRGKPVLSYSNTCYWFDASDAAFLDLDHLEDLPDRVRQTIADHIPKDAAARREFVRFCLSMTGRVAGPGERWHILAPEHLEIALRQEITRAWSKDVSGTNAGRP